MGIKQDFPKKHIVQKNRGSPLSNSAKRFFKCLAKHKGNHFEKIVFQEKFFQELRLEKSISKQNESVPEWKRRGVEFESRAVLKKTWNGFGVYPKNKKGSFSGQSVAAKWRWKKEEQRGPKNAKRANILIAERRVGPMDQMEPQNLESADSHFADWYRFKIIYRRKVPDSDSTSESRKPKRHGSVLKPLDSKAY